MAIANRQTIYAAAVLIAGVGIDSARQNWAAEWKLRNTVEDAHIQPVSTVVFSPDGKTLVTGGRDGGVKFWEVKTGKLLASSKVSQPIRSIAFSSNGRMLAIGTGES